MSACELDRASKTTTFCLSDFSQKHPKRPKLKLELSTGAQSDQSFLALFQFHWRASQTLLLRVAKTAPIFSNRPAQRGSGREEKGQKELQPSEASLKTCEKL